MLALAYYTFFLSIMIFFPLHVGGGALCGHFFFSRMLAKLMLHKNMCEPY